MAVPSFSNHSPCSPRSPCSLGELAFHLRNSSSVWMSHCVYCTQLGHFHASCPVKNRGTSGTMESQTSLSSKSSCLLPTVSLTSPSLSFQSSSPLGFLGWCQLHLARKFNLSSLPISQPIDSTALDGHLLYKVTPHAPLVILTFADFYTEELCFHLYRAPLHPLGHPWLIDHSFLFDWSSGKISAFRTDCEHPCFPAKAKDSITLAPASVSSVPPVNLIQVMVSFESPASETKFPDLSNVPSCHIDLKELYNKSKAKFLPPHCPHNFAIDQLPGTFPTKGYLCSLSGPETQVMKNHIDSALAAGIVHLSSSLAGAGYFLVGKKNKTLRPCIDYRGLDNFTIRKKSTPSFRFFRVWTGKGG